MVYQTTRNLWCINLVYQITKNLWCIRLTKTSGVPDYHKLLVYQTTRNLCIMDTSHLFSPASTTSSIQSINKHQTYLAAAGASPGQQIALEMAWMSLG